MTPLDLLGWLLSMAATLWLLLVVTPRMDPRRLLVRAAAAVAAPFVVVPAIVIGLWAIGFEPPDWFGTRLFQLVFACVLLAMLSFVNSVFHGMVDAVIRFHETRNAANLHRFPIRPLIRHRALLKRAATTIWCLGAGLMFYGVWTDLRV